MGLWTRGSKSSRTRQIKWLSGSTISSQSSEDILTERKVKVLVAQLYLTLLRPHGLARQSPHGFLQARILEWVAISSSRGSSQTKDQTQVSHTAGRFFTLWATRESLFSIVTNSTDNVQGFPLLHILSNIYL